jgi:hypothetical protein
MSSAIKGSGVMLINYKPLSDSISTHPPSVSILLSLLSNI